MRWLSLYLALSLLCMSPLAVYAEGEDDPLWNRPSFEKKIYNIGQRILQANGVKERIAFRYNNAAEVNAHAQRFASKNTVTINKGILNLVENDDELAAVLSHEIAHILQQHTRRVLPKVLAASAAMGALFGTAYYYSNRAVMPLYPLTPYAVQPVNKKYECEADLVGLDYMVKAGYNPLAMETVMTKITGDAGPIYTFFSSHPLGNKRLDDIREAIATKYPQFLTPEAANNLPGAPYQLQQEGESSETKPAVAEEASAEQKQLYSALQEIIQDGAVQASETEAIREGASSNTAPSEAPTLPAPKKVTALDEKTAVTAPPRRISSVSGKKVGKAASSSTPSKADYNNMSVAQLLLSLNADQLSFLKLLSQHESVDHDLFDLHFGHLDNVAAEIMLQDLENKKLIRMLGSSPEEHLYILTDRATEALQGQGK